ncbi:MAG TPA: TfoX/Sxy family protein [Bacilli bacterium]|nr:TfoX/Sxy family protein [Bacilli bacterium]
MATTKDYRDYILEELSLLDSIYCRSMMGEYLLYYDGTLFGGIYDSRLLVKIVDTNEKYNMEKAIPYPVAKLMYHISNIEDKEYIRDVVLDTVEGLKK